MVNVNIKIKNVKNPPKSSNWKIRFFPMLCTCLIIILDYNFYVKL